MKYFNMPTPALETLISLQDRQFSKDTGLGVQTRKLESPAHIQLGGYGNDQTTLEIGVDGRICGYIHINAEKDSGYIEPGVLLTSTKEDFYAFVTDVALALTEGRDITDDSQRSRDAFTEEARANAKTRTDKFFKKL